MTWWRVEKAVRFAHCDPAGIVFYSRFFELMQEATEDFFRHAIGMPFDQVVERDGLVMPAIALDVRWHAPSRLAEILAIDVGVAHLGTTSIHFAYEFTCGSERRMSARMKQVQTLRASGRPTPIAEPMRGRLERYRVTLNEEQFA